MVEFNSKIYVNLICSKELLIEYDTSKDTMNFFNLPATSFNRALAYQNYKYP